MQSILKAADEAVFIVKEEQYKAGLEGSIPVLVRSVSKLLLMKLVLSPCGGCFQYDSKHRSPKMTHEPLDAA